MNSRWMTALKIAVSAFLIYLALANIGLGNVANEIAAMEIIWLLSAIMLFLASHFLGSMQWQILLRSESVHLPYTHVLKYYFTGLFFNNFLISSMGGDVFSMVDIHRSSGQRAAAVSTVFLDRFAGLFVMFSLAIFSWPWLMMKNVAGSRMQLFMVILVAGWLAAIFVLFSRRVARPLAWILRRLLPVKFSQPMKEIYLQIHGFGRRGKLVFHVLLVALVVQAARIMTHYLLAKAFNVTLSPFVFFVMIPIIALSASLPISLGGLGVRERLGQILLAKVGVAASTAFSIEFMAYVVAIFTAIPGGIIFALRKSSKLNQSTSE